MAKGVFTTKLSPAFDDLPEVRYHFQKTYLRQVEQTLGDSIVYYEPRRESTDASSRGGRQGYFSIARPQTITQDPRDRDRFYCHLSDYLDFDRAVPFREGALYRESALKKEDGSTNRGAFGRSVRLIPDDEFQQILAAGLSGADTAGSPLSGAFMGVEELVIPFERPLIELTTVRPYRDLAFRRTVRSAYENRCAVTGLHLINGGGRPEVQAAHIRPVAAQGPDSVRNGLALSGTIHWLFDRGLLSVADDMTILAAKGHLPDAVFGLINPSGRLNLPVDQTKWPHPAFLRFHRETYFKG